MASLTLLPVPFKVIYNIYTIHFALFTRLFLATKIKLLYGHQWAKKYPNSFWSPKRIFWVRGFRQTIDRHTIFHFKIDYVTYPKYRPFFIIKGRFHVKKIPHIVLENKLSNLEFSLEYSVNIWPTSWEGLNLWSKALLSGPKYKILDFGQI